MTIKKLIEEEVSPFVTGRVMQAQTGKLSLKALVEAWAVVDFAEKLIKKRKEELRALLLGAAQEDGEETEKGGQQLRVDGSKVTRERRVATLPDPDKIKFLLSEQGLKISDGFTKPTPDWELDPSKLKHLVETGKLDMQSIEDARAVTYALRVRLSMKLEDALLETVAKPEPEVSATARPKRAKAEGKRKKQ